MEALSLVLLLPEFARRLPNLHLLFFIPFCFSFSSRFPSNERFFAHPSQTLTGPFVHELIDQFMRPYCTRLRSPARVVTATRAFALTHKVSFSHSYAHFCNIHSLLHSQRPKQTQIVQINLFKVITPNFELKYHPKSRSIYSVLLRLPWDKNICQNLETTCVSSVFSNFIYFFNEPSRSITWALYQRKEKTIFTKTNQSVLSSQLS